jgi:chaperonin cofactor prefoldin
MKQTLEFQTMVVSRLDKIEIRLDRLESDVKSIHHRIDNLVNLIKLNDLKE